MQAAADRPFAETCRHITNYTSGHETRISVAGLDRLDYPDNHIEVDSRLSFFLGSLARLYPDAYVVKVPGLGQNLLGHGGLAGLPGAGYDLDEASRFAQAALEHGVDRSSVVREHRDILLSMLRKITHPLDQSSTAPTKAMP